MDVRILSNHRKPSALAMTIRIPILDSQRAASQVLPPDLPPDDSPPDGAAPDTAEHQSYWLDKADALTQTGTALAQMPADISTKLEQAKQESGPSGAGFTGLALNTFDDYHQQASEALPPEARSTFTLAAKPYRDFIGQAALQYEARQRLDWRAGQYTQSADTWADQVARTPALLPLADAALRTTQPLLNPEQNTMLGEYARDKLVQSAVAGALAQDPAGLLKALGGSTAMPGTNDPDTQPQPGDIDLDHPLVKLMTPSERDHYREVARITVLQQQASQREDLKSRTADATQSYLDTGTAKNPPMLSDMVNAFGEEEGSTRYRQMRDAAMLGQTKQRILPLPQGELNRLRGQAPAEDDLQGQRNYKALTGAIDSIEQERRRDPIGFALKTNSYGLSPIKDFNDPAALAAELGRRSRAGNIIARDYNVPAAVLTRAEGRQLAGTLQTLPVDGQRNLLQQITGAIADPALQEAALRQLSADAPVAALAGLYLARDSAQAPPADQRTWGSTPDVPGLLLRGQALLAPNHGAPGTPYALPSDTLLRQAFARYTGDAYAAEPGKAELYLKASKALYAALDPWNNQDPAYDAGRWWRAVGWATAGNVVSQESGLSPQAGAGDARIQRMRNTYADASPGTTLDVGRQYLAGSSPVAESTPAPAQGENPTQLAGTFAVGRDRDIVEPRPHGNADAPAAMPDAQQPTPEELASKPPAARPKEMAHALEVSAAEGRRLAQLEKPILEKLSALRDEAEKTGTPIDQKQQAALTAQLKPLERASRVWNSQHLTLLWDARENYGGLSPNEESELRQRQAISVVPAMGAIQFGPKGAKPAKGGAPAIRQEVPGMAASDASGGSRERLPGTGTPDKSQPQQVPTIASGEAKRKSFDNLHLGELPIHADKGKFYVRAGELLSEQNIRPKHATNDLQREGSDLVGHGGVSNLSNEDLIRFGGPLGNDPISGYRSYGPNDDLHNPGSRFHIQTGHHRLEEIGKRVREGKISPNELIEIKIQKAD